MIVEINEVGGVNGCEIVFVVCDVCLDLVVYVWFVDELIVIECVNVLFGGYMLSSCKVLILIVEKWDKLLFYLMFYEGFEFLLNVIYIGVVLN